MSADTMAPAIPVRQGDPAGGAMPGWHIYADLTPPEVVNARRVRRIRVWVAIFLVLLLAVLGTAYEWGRMRLADATEAALAEEAIGETLRSQQTAFSGVTTTQGGINQARAQLATLMSSDVDVDHLLASIFTALPDGMAIDQITVTIPPQLGGVILDDRRSGADALDTSDSAHIGSVTLAGTGESLADLATFVENLRLIDGVVDPYPASNDASDEGTTFNVQFTLNEAALSLRYDVQEGE